MSEPRFRVVISAGYDVKPYDHREYKAGYLEHEILILDSAFGYKVVRSKVVKTVTRRTKYAHVTDSRLARYVQRMKDEAAKLELELAAVGGDADD